MKIYMVCDDWNGEMEFYDDFDAALARHRERFDEFFNTQAEWHNNNVSIEDFYIVEYELNVKE